MQRRTHWTIFVVIGLVVGLSPAGIVAEANGTADVSQVTTTQTVNCSFPVTRTDATGTEVTVESEPERIVTLAPSAAQTLWEIGAREKVVGVSQYADYLEGAETLTNVSGAGGGFVNIEEVVGLEPDLVLAPNVISNATVRKLRNAGVTVFKFEAAGSIEDVYRKTRLIGQLVGACEGADRIVAAMEERVSTIREAVADKPAPSVLYYLGGGFVAGNNTFIGSIIETAGGDNLAANAGIEGFAKMSGEVIVQRNPQWLIVTSRSAVPNGTPFASITAVQENQIIVVNNDYINQPAPRVVLPLTEIARQLHPEAIQSANISETPIGPANLSMANATATEQPVAADGGNATATAMTDTITGVPDGGTSGTAETTVQSDENGTTTASGNTDEASGNGTATSSGSGAGFGVVAVVCALVSTALLARRYD
jgi:iron complex transport system substrate-binding protein